MKRLTACLVFVLALGGGVRAQTSASHKLTEFTFNNGGDPLNGAYASSASHRMRLDAIGDAVGVGSTLSSAGFRMDPGFVDSYLPPGEVRNLRWSSKTALVWNPEKSVGTYDVYRDALGTLPGNYGACLQSALLNETATDATVPTSGTARFYLVTARNRLAEEGTKGFRSSGSERPNPAPCP